MEGRRKGKRKSPSPDQERKKAYDPADDEETVQESEHGVTENTRISGRSYSWPDSRGMPFESSRRHPLREGEGEAVTDYREDLPRRSPTGGGEFSDDEGSPESPREIPVQKPLKQGFDCRPVFLSVSINAILLAGLVLWLQQSSSTPIDIPHGKPEDPETAGEATRKATQVLQKELQQYVDEGLAKLPILSESEVDVIVKSTLTPFLDDIKNYLLPETLNKLVEKRLETIHIPSDKEIRSIAENDLRDLKEWFNSELQRRDEVLQKMLKEMEDSLSNQFGKQQWPPEDAKQEVMQSLGLQMDRKIQSKMLELGSVQEAHLTAAEKSLRNLLHREVTYTIETLRGEATQSYLLSVASFVLAFVALMVAFYRRTVKTPATAVSSNPPAAADVAAMSPYFAHLEQVEKAEKEALQWSGTLAKDVCVVHFGHNQELHQHHMQLTQRALKNRPLQATVNRVPDIRTVPGAQLYVVYVSFNDRNIILESPEKGTGGLRVTTVKALQDRGADLVLVYSGDDGSASIPNGQLYNTYLTSVESHLVLSQLRNKERFLSIKKDFLDHQCQHLRKVVNAALNRQA